MKIEIQNMFECPFLFKEENMLSEITCDIDEICSLIRNRIITVIWKGE